jgi:hypothetical protein
MYFASIVDHVNYRGYLIGDVPANYGVLSPYFFAENTAGPVYSPIDGETCRGLYAIVHLVDLHFNKIPFTILYNGDIVDIKRNLKWYLEHMHEEKPRDRAILEFNKKAHELYKVMCTKAEILAKMYPDQKRFEKSPFATLLQQAHNA